MVEDRYFGSTSGMRRSLRPGLGAWGAANMLQVWAAGLFKSMSASAAAGKTRNM